MIVPPGSAVMLAALRALINVSSTDRTSWFYCPAVDSEPSRLYIQTQSICRRFLTAVVSFPVLEEHPLVRHCLRRACATDRITGNAMGCV